MRGSMAVVVLLTLGSTVSWSGQVLAADQTPWFQKGRAAFRQGDYKAAVGLFSRAIKAAPQTPA
ncbi:MAG: tetratricopeptide repeat protein, partial [Proteobacteria bacterium]|nr:tetratricopeptide repeat protein [Pseudomonadota bacterium]